MNDPICPRCQSPVPSDAPGGLCPSCLLLGAVAPTDMGAAGMTHAPSVEAVRAAFPELEVLEIFGHGGMGVVFKARQARLDRLVALKILPPALAKQPGFSERFTREARALARLSHPNIVAVYDFGERAGFYFLLMEFVNGVNLRQAIRAGVKPAQALALVPRICEALQFAHDHGVLHRDIKPENILLDVSGTPKLADFGIAKLAGEPGSAPDLTLTGASLGTAAYMAPEQIEHPGEVDHRADIYSLGVVLYEMLTGELPLGRFAPPSEKANVARGVDEVVFRALEKERGRRQQSATEMKTEVEGVGSGAPGAQSRPAGGGPARRGPGGKDQWELSTTHQFLKLLVVLCALAIPFSAVTHPRGDLLQPASLAILTAVFGAIYGLWPGPRWQKVVPPGSPGAAGLSAGAGQAGRGLALWGAWLHLVPVILGICFIPLWLELADLHNNPATNHFPEALRPHVPALLGYFIPSVLAVVLGFIFTIIAYFGYRYRAPWFLGWLIFYGIALLPLGVGVGILLVVLWRKDEFSLAAPATARGTPATPPAGKRSTAVLGLVLSLLAAGGVCLGAMHWAEGRGLALRGEADAVFEVQASNHANLESRLAQHPTTELKIDLEAADRALIRAGAARTRVYATDYAVMPITLAWAGAGIGLLLALIFGAMALARPPQGSPGPARFPSAARNFCFLLGGVALPALVGAIMLARGGLRFGPPVEKHSSGYETTEPVSVVVAGQPSSAAHLGGGTVELVAVSQHPSNELPWWQMDGLAAKEGPFLIPGGRVFAERGERAYEFVFHLRDLPDGSSLPAVKIEDMHAGAFGMAPALAAKPAEPLPGYASAAASLPESVERANVKVGVAYEPWQMVSQNAPNNSMEFTGVVGGCEWKVTHGVGVDTKAGEVLVTFSYIPFLDWETRVVAVKQDNTEVSATRTSRINHQSEIYFSGLTLAEVRFFRFQVRPFRWVEFRGIALAPVERQVQAASPSNATAALYEEGIRLARKRLERTRERVAAKVASSMDEALDERDLAVAEARGNQRMAAEAKVRYATRKLEVTRESAKAGIISNEELEAVEAELNQARLEAQSASVPASAPAPATKASAALYEEGVRMARQRLDETRIRVKAGLATPVDGTLAERDLAIAEARGNPAAVADAKVRYGTTKVALLRQRMEAGLATAEELRNAEVELNQAQLDVESAKTGAR